MSRSHNTDENHDVPTQGWVAQTVRLWVDAGPCSRPTTSPMMRASHKKTHTHSHTYAHTHADHVDFEFTVGPVPWEDDQGREVVTRYSTGLPTNGTWVSDSNGRYV